MNYTLRIVSLGIARTHPWVDLAPMVPTSSSHRSSSVVIKVTGHACLDSCMSHEMAYFTCTKNSYTVTIYSFDHFEYNRAMKAPTINMKAFIVCQYNINSTMSNKS